MEKSWNHEIAGNRRKSGWGNWTYFSHKDWTKAKHDSWDKIFEALSCWSILWGFSFSESKTNV